MSNAVNNKLSFTWRGIDLVTSAILAVALGVAFWGFDTLIYPLLGLVTAGFPPVGELALGIWIIPAVTGSLLVRRPGAAIFMELIAANVELLLGNTWGITVLVSALLQAVGVEIVFLIFRYRRFNFAIAALGGMLSAVFEICFYEWWSYVPDYSPLFKAIFLVCGMISGALLAGGGAFWLIRGLGKTGTLNAFAAGREARSI
jgi:energy-coupling factor transport system substrate-specific component